MWRKCVNLYADALVTVTDADEPGGAVLAFCPKSYLLDDPPWPLMPG